MKTIELCETRAAYAATIQDLVTSAEPVVIERDGKPVAVVVPYDLYQQLTRAPQIEKKTISDEIFERNRATYYAMKDELLKTHRGKWVAFHDGQFMDSDADDSALSERMHTKYGYGKLYIHLVEEPEHVYRVPTPFIPRKQ